MRKFSAAVVGLGRIGQGYDYACEDGTSVRTHASAFHNHDGYELVAGVDPLGEERRRFEEKYQRPTYDDVHALLRHHELDVIALAVPTEHHLETLKKIVGRDLRAVVCEKPIAATLTHANRMVDLAGQCGTALLVNYQRRFEPGVIELRDAIGREELGDIYKGTVWYSKGLVNNGSHFIDLLLFLLGDASEVTVLDPGRKCDGDWEPDLMIRFGNASMYFLAGREEHFSIGDVELVGTKGRAQYRIGGGIELRASEAHPHIPGYRRLSPSARTLPNENDRYQWHVVQHLYQHLTANTRLNSDGHTALKTLRVVDEAIQQL